MMVLLVVAIILKDFVYQPRIRATRFEVVDSTGHVRAMWRAQDETTALIFRDQQGAWRSVISEGPDGARLRLEDRQGRAVVALRAEPGQASIEVRGSDGSTLRLAPTPPSPTEAPR